MPTKLETFQTLLDNLFSYAKIQSGHDFEKPTVDQAVAFCKLNKSTPMDRLESQCVTMLGNVAESLNTEARNKIRRYFQAMIELVD